LPDEVAQAAAAPEPPQPHDGESAHRVQRRPWAQPSMRKPCGAISTKAAQPGSDPAVFRPEVGFTKSAQPGSDPGVPALYPSRQEAPRRNAREPAEEQAQPCEPRQLAAHRP